MQRILKAIHKITGWRHFSLLASLILIGAFMIGFYWRDMVRSEMCSMAEDEHCFREWIGATAGWIAAVFAYFTIRTMNRQTAEANRHQKENIELQVLDRLRDAEKIIEQCHVGKALCRTLKKRLEMAYDGQDYRLVLPGTIAKAFRLLIREEVMRSPQPSSPKLPDITELLTYFETIDVPFKDAVKTGKQELIYPMFVTMVMHLDGIEALLTAIEEESDWFVGHWINRITDAEF